MVGQKCPTEALRSTVQKTYECLPLNCHNITGIRKANFGEKWESILNEEKNHNK